MKNERICFEHLGIEVVEEYLTIPTYKEGPADLNPPLFEKGVKDIYPYKYQNSFTNEVVEKNYQVIKIKSPFIEVSMLPDWGMHLYRAVDLITGRDMFHCPKVMKPANNAIRGAYVAGGVEMNFPIGHNAVTWSRCAMALQRTNEGVSCLFNHIDRCSGMTISAGITVSPDYRGILFDQYLYNSTPLPRPWYYWLNAGIAPHPSLKFKFPAQRMLEHFEGPFLETKKNCTYPIHNGVDYSKNGEVPEPIGLFAFGNPDGWFGAWYDDWNFGIARWAAPWQAGGKKFWSWGNSKEGLLWGKIAADQELPVPEIQSGRPEVQMDRGIVLPYKTKCHREWWFPVSDIGDMAIVSKHLALNIVKDGKDAVSLKFSGASSLTDCCLIIDGEKVEDGIRIASGKIYEKNISVAKDSITQIKLKNNMGTVIQWDSKQPVEAANVSSLLDKSEPVSEMSADDLYQKGFHFYRMLRPDLARKFYRKALEKDPRHSQTHTQLGILLFVEQGDFKGAAHEFEQAMSSNRRNEQALYLHGLAALWNGNVSQAVTDFSHCAATGEAFVVPSIIQLARKAFHEKEFEQVLFMVAEGLKSENSPELKLLKALTFRETGKVDEYAKLLSDIEGLLGASLITEFERECNGMAKFAEWISGSQDTDDFCRIQCALKYAELDLTAKAVQLLSGCKSPEGKTEAGYLLKWLGETSELDNVKVPFFAYGKEIKEALLKTLENDRNDTVALFSLGCLFARQGNLVKAVEFLERAAENEPENSLVLTTLGCVYHKSGKSDDAINILNNAIIVKPYNPLSWIELDRALHTAGKRDFEWLQRFKNAPGEVLINEKARETLAKLCYEMDDFNGTVNLLKDFIFHPYELIHDLRNLWSAAYRCMAIEKVAENDYENAGKLIELALSYPENLCLGKPLRCFDAKTLYTAALIYERIGDRRKAAGFSEKAADEYNPDPSPVKPWSILAELKLGRTEDATVKLDKLENETRLYLESEFQPDLNDELNKILNLCDKIKSGWIPDLNDEMLKRKW